MFKANPDYSPIGDQPEAIASLARLIKAGDRYQTLLGATGTGKTATCGWLIEEVQKPTLIIVHNKTLAAQLCNEYREFFPSNAVEYFVSYYDYYRPEAYIPSSDVYIEKDAQVNEEIDRLRHAATSALLTRRDVIVVASVSAIYGLGSPERYRSQTIFLKQGENYDREELLRKLVDVHYIRQDILARGRFRLRGDTLEIQPANEEIAWRVGFFGDQIEDIVQFDPLLNKIIKKTQEAVIFPATQYIVDSDIVAQATKAIEKELIVCIKELKGLGKELEAYRLKQRTEYDLEMIKELGWCGGIENYSRHLEGRVAGKPPYTLLDYFPNDFLCLIDESHVTIPQIGGMYEGDRSRKKSLIEYGFRLPSALDNRPLRFEEFLEKVPQIVFVSATPGSFELQNSSNIAEQIVRPTGVVDPEIIVRPATNQIDDLLDEIKIRVKHKERTLVTTLTKKMAEDLADYLLDVGIKTKYLHSDIETLERIQIIRELRLGEYDVLVGVNLLREGLDLPEVSLVAILDANKEGFLRGKTALIQTIGRAARNVNGRVLMYADKQSKAMEEAIEETTRRRNRQLAYNKKNNIVPRSIIKGVSDIGDLLALGKKVPGKSRTSKNVDGLSKSEINNLIGALEEEMSLAAEELRFEYAAKLRDEIKDLRQKT